MPAAFGLMTMPPHAATIVTCKVAGSVVSVVIFVHIFGVVVGHRRSRIAGTGRVAGSEDRETARRCRHGDGRCRHRFGQRDGERRRAGRKNEGRATRHARAERDDGMTVGVERAGPDDGTVEFGRYRRTAQ